ncbi:MAG: type II secretion system GspH family protein [Firmicutes bacterium]|nr:type II secretion system GspH family protein [Bacillota bacterium]MBU4553868.1 type II secretion system GspH family protein [Bacillota bacterium]MBV1728382.1 type II secretion system GspH family protein [Desulforudis sp.]MBV1770111.1 type II secretion system GspH family protein [Desulforudis sp.]
MSFADRNQGEQGFTLLELMIALGIFAIVLVIITSVLGGQLRLFGDSNEERRNLHEARLAMEAVVDELEAAREDGYKLDLVGDTISGVKLDPDPESVPLVSTVKSAARIYLDDNELIKNGQLVSRNVSLRFSPMTQDDVDLRIKDVPIIKVDDEFHFIKIEIEAGDPTQSGYALTTIVGTASRLPL